MEFVLSFVLFGLAAQATDFPCVVDGPGSAATSDMTRAALAMLAAAGHDAERYRLELRMEPATRPDFPELGGQRVPSVVFLPRDPSRDPALRVHPARPCAVGWVWQPERFTDWQRAVVELARERLASAGALRSADVVDLWAIETAEEVEVGIDGADERADRVVVKKNEAGRPGGG